MTPTDATNLLLALMYDGELTRCHEAVGILRGAHFQHARQHKRGETPVSVPDLAPHRFLRNESGLPLDLGGVLDTMIDWFVRYGTLEESPEAEHPTFEDEDAWEYYAINISVSVEAPGHRCTIHVDAFETIWDLHYRWKSDEELNYERQRPVTGIDVRPRFDILGGEYISTTKTIGENGLLTVAEILRDGPDNYDGCGEVRAPYDISPLWQAVTKTSHSDGGPRL